MLNSKQLNYWRGCKQNITNSAPLARHYVHTKMLNTKQVLPDEYEYLQDKQKAEYKATKPGYC